MRSEKECWRIVDEAVASMEMEGFHPTDEDRMRAFLYASGKITMEEAMSLDEIMNPGPTTNLSRKRSCSYGR